MIDQTGEWNIANKNLRCVNIAQRIVHSVSMNARTIGSARKPVLDEAPGNLPYIQSRRRCVSTSPFLAAMRSIKVVCVGDARCGKVLSISPLCFRFEPERFNVWPLDRCFGKAYI